MQENNSESAEEGLIFYKSSNPFEFYHILNSKECEEQNMFGTLILPNEKKDTYPLVICMHGSMGWRGHHHEHSVNFLNNGFAIFRVNSFDARQVTSIVEDQMQVTLATVMTDCFNALKILAKHPKIDAAKICQLSGCHMVIANGLINRPIKNILSKNKYGKYLAPT